MHFSLAPGIYPAREFGPELMTFWKIWIHHILRRDLRLDRRILWLSKSKKRKALLEKVKVHRDLSGDIPTFLKTVFFFCFVFFHLLRISFTRGPNIRFLSAVSGTQTSRATAQQTISQVCEVYCSFITLKFLCYSSKKNKNKKFHSVYQVFLRGNGLCFPREETQTYLLI